MTEVLTCSYHIRLRTEGSDDLARKHIKSHAPEDPVQLVPASRVSQTPFHRCNAESPLILQHHTPVINHPRKIEFAMSVQYNGSRKGTPPFPTRQMTILGNSQKHCYFTIANVSLTLCSIVPDLRTNCVHVYIPLRLLHDQRLRDYQERFRHFSVRWYGYVCLRLRRVLFGCRMGQTE